jgi:phage baseplate assembly protein W
MSTNGLERTPASRVEAPQIALPFEITPSGTVREVEQDTLDEIAMSVQAILLYRLGDRTELPDFGIPEPTFAMMTEDLSAALASAVSRWEDRAQIFIQERPGDWDNMVRDFQVQVRSRVDQ